MKGLFFLTRHSWTSQNTEHLTYTHRDVKHHQQNISRDLMGRREARGRSNGQQLTNQCHCPHERDFARKRKLSLCLQQAPSRDKGNIFVSLDIHGHPRTLNISPTPTERDAKQREQWDLTGRREPEGRSNGQQSANQRHSPNERYFGRNRKLPPLPAKQKIATPPARSPVQGQRG
jgi:hypothetical protein